MKNEEKEIFVYLDVKNQEPELIGKLYVSSERGRENYSFEYDDEWLKNSDFRIALDPDLKMYSGRQYTPIDKKMFGIFADSCPDRWGRMLMNRREIIDARRQQRKPRKLREIDYLLGVYDESRMGALRFSEEKGGAFLSDEKELAAPPWTTLRTLENASISLENDAAGRQEKWLNQLLAPGSSLGGARPKASVTAPDGSLWIAKFPSKHDENNSGAWEMVAHDLALQCGLNVPEATLEDFSKLGSTFLVKRFDREGGKRVHFASAMTMLGRADGDSATEGSGYLEIASFLRTSGASAADDLMELWKRIVFNMAVSNTDDHLRNHGFILDTKGWSLSPLYDVNPCIYGDKLSLNVSELDNSIDFGLAVETAEYYGIELNKAVRIAADISGIVSDKWKGIAKKYGLGREAIMFMEPSFCKKWNR